MNVFEFKSLNFVCSKSSLVKLHGSCVLLFLLKCKFCCFGCLIWILSFTSENLLTTNLKTKDLLDMDDILSFTSENLLTTNLKTKALLLLFLIPILSLLQDGTIFLDTYISTNNNNKIIIKPFIVIVKWREYVKVCKISSQ